MIYVTGDTHGELSRLTQAPCGAGDTLIVCGDFGFLYRNDAQEHRMLDELEKLPFTVCFADGNHENFDALNALPAENWQGGRVHRLRQNILHLMRGQVFRIEDKTFYVMGGAYSIDRAARHGGWWEAELPTAEEYEEGWRNLRAHGERVDYIITHNAPDKVLLYWKLDPVFEDWQLRDHLQQVMKRVEFRHWFFGHWHEDKTCLPLYPVTMLSLKTVVLDGRERFL